MQEATSTRQRKLLRMEDFCICGCCPGPGRRGSWPFDYAEFIEAFSGETLYDVGDFKSWESPKLYSRCHKIGSFYVWSAPNSISAEAPPRPRWGNLPLTVYLWQEKDKLQKEENSFKWEDKWERGWERMKGKLRRGRGWNEGIKVGVALSLDS